MKINFISLFALTFTLLPLHSFAADDWQLKKPSCIHSEQEIQSSNKIKSFIEKMGGIRNLEGTWKLGGFAGQVKNVTVKFETLGTGLRSTVVGLDPVPEIKYIEVCETKKANILHVKTDTSPNTLLIKYSSSTTMDLARVKGNKTENFYSFYKLKK